MLPVFARRASCCYPVDAQPTKCVDGERQSCSSHISTNGGVCAEAPTTLAQDELEASGPGGRVAPRRGLVV